MKKFYIITNKAKDADYSFTKEIEQYVPKKTMRLSKRNQEQTGAIRITAIPMQGRFRQIQSVLLYLAGTER